MAPVAIKMPINLMASVLIMTLIRQIRAMVKPIPVLPVMSKGCILIVDLLIVSPFTITIFPLNLADLLEAQLKYKVVVGLVKPMPMPITVLPVQAGIIFSPIPN